MRTRLGLLKKEIIQAGALFMGMQLFLLYGNHYAIGAMDYANSILTFSVIQLPAADWPATATVVVTMTKTVAFKAADCLLPAKFCILYSGMDFLTTD